MPILSLLLAAAGFLQIELPSPPPGRLGALLHGDIAVQGSGAPIGGARISLFTPDLAFFAEARSDAAGAYELRALPAGTYRLGVAAPGFDYEEVGIAITPRLNRRDFALHVETESGRWDIIGNTLPETLDATDIGALRPDGRILYCHNTIEPVLFDPRTGDKIYPPSSGSEQGCMNTTLLDDGSVLIVGGQSPADPGDFRNAVPWVKRLRPDNTWERLADMRLTEGRWYPGLARLSDGNLLVMGGGTRPDAKRTDTCERFDKGTLTWAFTGSMSAPNEFAPSALLFTGKVLRTWGGRPQLYDVQSGTWADTGSLVFPDRGYPGHSDHSLVLLSDGRALVVGINFGSQPAAAMTEYYDPATGAWSAGTSPDLRRMQAEVVYLPDGHVLVAAGDQQTTSGPERNVLGIVRRSDLLDPLAASWRRVADMLEFREYHAITLLVPDGRVLTTGGTRIKFQYGPTDANVEAYRPPYLFRGVRPRIANLSDPTPARGATLRFDVFPGTRLTAAVLMGVQSTTHWVEGGIPRRLVLGVAQSGAQASVTLPSDPVRLPLGWYLLFAMVDDIPSEALFLRVDA